MAYQPQPVEPDTGANWADLGEAQRDALAMAGPDVLQARADLAAAVTAIGEAQASLAPAHDPVFTGTVTGVSKAMVGLGNVDNTSDAAKRPTAAQFTSGTLDPARLPVEVAVIRVRAPEDEAYPTGNNWGPRPEGGTVLAIGAPPRPADAYGTDLFFSTAPTNAPAPPEPGEPPTPTDPGTPPDPTNGPGSGGGTGTRLPAQILNLSQWKITLPVDSNGSLGNSLKAVEVKRPALDTYRDAYVYATADNAAVTFKAVSGGATTSGSLYPRSELREMTGSSGTTNASWGFNDGLEHDMVITQRVPELPKRKPQVVCGQIHDAADDNLIVLADGFRPTSGTVAATGTSTIPYQIVWKWHGVVMPVPLITGYVANELFTVRVHVAGNRMFLYADKGPVATTMRAVQSGLAGTFPASATSGCYFKAGAYSQSNTTNEGKNVPTKTTSGGGNLTSPAAGTPTGGDSASTATRVVISGLRVAHTAKGDLWPGAHINLEDGSQIRIHAGSTKFDAVDLIGNVTVDARDQATWNAYRASFPEHQLLPGLRQAAANICALLYDAPNKVPRKHANVTLRFLNEDFLAWTIGQTSTIEYGTQSRGATVTASYTTHEVVHLFGYGEGYGTTQYVSGVVEGIADWCLIQLGYHNRADHAPSDGGGHWADGYRTTSFFFDYVENHAPTKSPGFVRAINTSLSKTGWTPTAIRDANARKMTVDQLWAEYKTWLGHPITPPATATLPFTDRTNVAFSGAGQSSDYHAWAAGLSAGAGLFIWLHGDAAYEHKNPNSVYVFGGTSGVRAVTKSRGWICVSAKDPGTLEWWKNGNTKADYLAALLDHLTKGYAVDPTRVVIAGFSGGAQQTTQFFMGRHHAKLEKATKGGTIVFGGGEAPDVTPAYSTALKSAIRMYWAAGQNDTSANASDGFDGRGAATYGEQWFRGKGFRTQIEIQPGQGHELNNFGTLVAKTLDNWK